MKNRGYSRTVILFRRLFRRLFLLVIAPVGLVVSLFRRSPREWLHDLRNEW